MNALKATSVEIDSKLCKSCGLCVGVCPKNVFTRDPYGAPVQEHPEQCVACGACELQCPDFAIRIVESA